MNDDELDNIFGVNEDDNSVDDTAETGSDEKDTDEITAEDFAQDQEKNEESPAAKEKKSSSKDALKAQRAAEREKAMQSAEKYFEELRAKRAASRKAHKEERMKRKSELPPLNERTYLDKFPLTFKTTILALLGLVLLASGLVLGFHPMFRIESFVVEGNHAMTEEQLIEATGLDYNDHVFAVFGINRSHIKELNPYILDLDISFNLPSVVTIKVQERQKVAYIKNADGYFAIDAEGTVLEFSAEASEDAHPLLCGLDVDRVVLGQKVDIKNNTQFQKLIIVLGAVLAADEDSLDDGYSFFENVREIRLVPSGYIFMTLTLPNGSTFLVKFYDMETISDDMHWLMFVVQEGTLNDFPDGVLDMTDEVTRYWQYDF